MATREKDSAADPQHAPVAEVKAQTAEQIAAELAKRHVEAIHAEDAAAGLLVDALGVGRQEARVKMRALAPAAMATLLGELAKQLPDETQTGRAARLSKALG